jgi:hypothetical protein
MTVRGSGVDCGMVYPNRTIISQSTPDPLAVATMAVVGA